MLAAIMRAKRVTGLAWALWALAMLGLVAVWWLDHLLRQAGRSDLAPLGAAVAAPVLAAVSSATVGAVAASRRPAHPVGWLLLALALSLNVSGVASASADYGLVARPGALPAARHVALYLPPPASPPFAITNLAVVVGAASLVVRFRRARGTERQQLRWVVLAATLALLGSVVLLVAVSLGTSPGLLGWVAGVYFAILPLAIGAAILRYRLYDLDRTVSRTLAWGLLTVLLGLGYAGVVLSLGRFLPKDSSLVVAGGTPTAAATPSPR